MINKDVEKILVSEQEILKIVKRISAQITEDYKTRDSKLLLLGIQE